MKSIRIYFIVAILLMVISGLTYAGKITDYVTATAPKAADVVVGTDTTDTSMAPTGTTKKFRLGDLPVSTPVQTAINNAVANKADTSALALKADASALAGKQDYHVNLSNLAGGIVHGSMITGTVPDSTLSALIARYASIGGHTIGLDTSVFGNNLSTTDDTIQKIAKKFNDFTASGGTPTTILADVTDNTKAARSVLADSATTASSATNATHAATADSATTATSATSAATATNANHATTADSATTATTATTATSATNANHATTADSATTSSGVNGSKASGVPGFMFLYEANSTDTNGAGFLGPDNETGNVYFKFPDGVPSSGQLWSFGAPVTQNVNGVSSTVVPIVPVTSGAGTVTATSTDTFSNKTISALTNTITNIGTANIATASLITSTGIATAATDSAIPTWGAVYAFMNSVLVTGTPIISFTTPSTSGLWSQSTSFTVSGSAYASKGISIIDWKLGAGGTYSTTGVTGTTSWSIPLTLSSGANTVYARVTDTSSTTTEASTVINVDTVNPVVSLGSAQTHDGTGKTVTLTSSMFTEANIASVEYWLDSGSHTTWVSPYNNVNVSIPADTSDHVVSLRVTDLSGRTTTGTLSVTYQVWACGNTAVYSYTSLDSWAALGTDHFTNARIGGIYTGSDVSFCGVEFNAQTHGTVTGIQYRVIITSLSGNNVSTVLSTSNATAGPSANGVYRLNFSSSVTLHNGEGIYIEKVNNTTDDTTNYITINYTYNSGSTFGFAIWNSSGSNQSYTAGRPFYLRLLQ